MAESDKINRNESDVLRFLIVVELILIIVYIAPYLICNKLTGIDFPMHLFYASYYEKELFPRLIGWNPHLFAGIAQGQLYPSLFHWLAGGIGKIAGIGSFWALKLLTAVGILLTPISFVYFLRRMGYDGLEVIFTASAMLILCMCSVFFTGICAGGEFVSTLHVGSVSQGFSLPLFFFYIGMYIDRIKNRRDYLDSLVLAVTFLIHSNTGIVGAMVSFVVTLLAKKTTHPPATITYR